MFLRLLKVNNSLNNIMARQIKTMKPIPKKRKAKILFAM